MHISNLKIGIRLSLGFGAIAMLLTAVAFIGITCLAKLNDGTNVIVHDRYPKTAKLQTIDAEVNIDARAMRNMILSADPKQVEQEAARLAASNAIVDKKLAELDAEMHSDTGRALLKAIVDTHQRYLAQQLVFKQLVAADKKDEARNLLFAQLRTVQNDYFDALDKGIAYQAKLMEQGEIDAAEEYRNARNLMLILTATALAVAAIVSYWITRSITRPVDTALKFAQSIALGDLSGHIESESSDETGQLLRTLVEMNDNLAHIVGQVRSGTDSIAAASGEIALGNLDLSSRTEEQASSLEETASSMEELASTVKQNSDNAREANGLTQSAAEVAVRGGTVVSDVVKTMASINESSQKIVDIISVIDGIAFQTNILALNAAVEAARAGEQGRGFAVVAAEVRVLAQRSASAAKEIKDLIGNSVEKVHLGSNLVDRAGATMSEIVASVQRVTHVMEEIATASIEQNTGIEQVNQAIAEMDTVTQQNAALVEQAAAAAQAMQDQAATLAKLVSKFVLSSNAASDTDAGAPSRPMPPSGKIGASVGVPLTLANSVRRAG